MNTISERFKYLRKKYLKLTQTEFGNVLGVNRSVINNIENNRLKNPEQKEPLYRFICDKYNINYDWLKYGKGEMLKTLNRNERIASFAGELLADEEPSFKKRFIEALSQLDVEEWIVLEKIARSFVEKRANGNDEDTPK